MIANYPTISLAQGLPIPFKDFSTKRENARVITPKPCVLYSVWLDYDGSAGVVYLHVFDAGTPPGDGLVPTLPPVPIVEGFQILDCSTIGVPMFEGVTVALSSNRDTLTNVPGATAKLGGIFLPIER